MQAIRESQFVGAVLWVESKGAAYHKAFGQRATKPAAEPMTEDTIFDVASITMAVATTSAAMWCVDRDLFAVDDPVAEHLPEFTGEGREKIALRHLLLHTSSLQVNLNGTRPPFSRSPAGIRAQLRREKPMLEPGTAFAHSSTGMMALGSVIERVTGRTRSVRRCGPCGP
jgi:CubicO group peptidase (beta-lactamase class C family)